MARLLGKLNALAVMRARGRGYLSDGGGLYLQVGPHGSKSWVFRYRDAGRLREMGLGPLHTVSLAEAREAALQCRKQRIAGTDPMEARRASRSAARLEAARVITFAQCASAYVEAQRAGWKSEKHASQWRATLNAYAYPVIGDFPVQAVDVSLVMKVLDPIWSTKAETASRVRGRIEAVLDWATVRGYRTGENPARWRGHLDHLLPERSKVARVTHHAALPFQEIRVFLSELRQQPGIAARALEFLVLTATRTGEAIGATWAEIDFESGIWTIPGTRMKAGKDHRVPLSEPAIEILARLPKADSLECVFPGGKAGKGLSNMALLAVLRRMNRGDLTVHGFRSTFRDWAGETTAHPREVVEAALAHRLGDKVEQAYARGDLFQKRRKLMNEWALYSGERCSQARSRIAEILDSAIS